LKGRPEGPKQQARRVIRRSKLCVWATIAHTILKYRITVLTESHIMFCTPGLAQNPSSALHSCHVKWLLSLIVVYHVGWESGAGRTLWRGSLFTSCPCLTLYRIPTPTTQQIGNAVKRWDRWNRCASAVWYQHDDTLDNAMKYATPKLRKESPKETKSLRLSLPAFQPNRIPS
jgi:hypothetical protein